MASSSSEWEPACLVFAEQWVPSGLAAVFITLSPFWMIGIDALDTRRRAAAHGPTLFAMLVGLAGTTLLGCAGGHARRVWWSVCCADL